MPAQETVEMGVSHRTHAVQKEYMRRQGTAVALDWLLEFAFLLLQPDRCQGRAELAHYHGVLANCLPQAVYIATDSTLLGCFEAAGIDEGCELRPYSLHRVEEDVGTDIADALNAFDHLAHFGG